MKTPKLPSSPGLASSHPLNTKTFIQPSTGDTHYVCADNGETHGQSPPTDGEAIGQRKQLAMDGLPGEGSISLPV